MKRILISGIFIGAFIVIGTIVAILFARGYRFDFSGNTGGKFIEGTGLFVATSRPDGARVLINSHLTTATNNTINLSPGEYEVTIQKDGYIDWHKKITIKNGLVSEADALLLPSAPKLEGITTIGVKSVIMDPTHTYLAYTVASTSATQNGIYVMNMNAGPFVFLGTGGTQIVSDVLDNFSGADISFSPDSKQVLAKLPNATYLLNAQAQDQNAQDITNIIEATERTFDQEKMAINKKLNDSLPRNLRPVATAYFGNMSPSPLGDKVLYTASVSATLPYVLKQKVPSLNSTPDNRELKQGNVYIYDIKEDKNYLIFDITGLKNSPKEAPNFLWHSDSKHVIFAQGSKIEIMEYDGGNKTTVFDAPFVDSLVFPWPDGSSIAFVFRLSSDVPYNLYRISLQ